MSLFDFFKRDNRPGTDKVKESETELMIESDGYIWQHKLWRRWIMGQMFHNLSWGDKPLNLKYYYVRLRKKDPEYCKKLTKEEKRMQTLLEKKGDTEELEERKRWYNNTVFTDVIEHEIMESWYEAYKGSGAYFTMKNLILFHNCKFHEDNQVLSQEDSLEHLKELNFDPKTTGDIMLNTMMKLINDNQFTYSKYHLAIR